MLRRDQVMFGFVDVVSWMCCNTSPTHSASGGLVVVRRAVANQSKNIITETRDDRNFCEAVHRLWPLLFEATVKSIGMPTACVGQGFLGGFLARASRFERACGRRFARCKSSRGVRYVRDIDLASRDDLHPTAPEESQLQVPADTK